MCQKGQYGMRCNDHTSNYVLSLIYLRMVKMKKKMNKKKDQKGGNLVNSRVYI